MEQCQPFGTDQGPLLPGVSLVHTLFAKTGDFATAIAMLLAIFRQILALHDPYSFTVKNRICIVERFQKLRPHTFQRHQKQ